MSDSLDKLTEMVRQAEAKSRAQRIHIEVSSASEQLRTAAERVRRADQRLREVRPARLRELEQSEMQEQQLKDLVKKVAQMKPSLEVAGSPEDLIVNAHREIEVKRREARAELEEVVTEAEEAKRELRTAMDQYQQLRLDLDRLQPHLAAGLSDEDRIVKEAAMFFPSGQLQALAKEVEDGVAHYALLDSREQYAQLKIWIGRYRHLQTFPLNEDEQSMSRRIFSKLVGLSKEYEPGYIEAFQINFTCDWDQFIAEAQEQLRQATEAARRKREIERQHADYQSREPERGRMARESAQVALDELKTILIRYNLPDEGADEFRAVLNRVVAGLGASDPQVLDLVTPFRDLIDTWGEFGALKRNLDRTQENDSDSDDAAQEQFEDLLSVTRGMRVLLIGGMAREDSRRLIERVFDFDRVEWEEYEDTSPVLLDALEQRVRNRDMDLVLILGSTSRQHVPEKLRPVCEQYGIPCLMVEHGNGPAQIGDALRRGLLKTV
jgi:hypothetical protein